MKKNKAIIRLHTECIESTEKGVLVKPKTITVTELTRVVIEGIGLSFNKVYMTSKALKHCYDKRDPMEYDFVIQHLKEVVRFPEMILENQPSQRGKFCFVKTIKKVTVMVSLEEVEEGDIKGNFVVTAYRIKKPINYFRDYRILWSWEDGNPPS